MGWGESMVPTRANREGDTQPMPTPNGHTDIQSLVMADIAKRREVGVERYGTALQPFNGRSALQDAYEEVLDLACYLRQKIEEDRIDDEARVHYAAVEEDRSVGSNEAVVSCQTAEMEWPLPLDELGYGDGTYDMAHVDPYGDT